MIKRPPLRHLINVMQPSSVFTGKGDKQITYAPDSSYPQLYGAIEALAGRELAVAKGIRADVTHKITIRGVSGIAPFVTSDTQLTWNDGFKTYTFQVGPAVDPENMHALASYYCIEIK